MLLTGKRWIYRPENEAIQSQWRYLREETRCSLGKSEVMEGVTLLILSVSGAFRDGDSGEARAGGRDGSCPSTVSQGASSAVG